jgi:methionyl-tRNA formyltransferase
MELGLPLLKPAKLDAEARSAIAAFQPDLLVSFAYGKIFGPKFLGLFPLGGINIHPSLLPKYRGPTPINAAILRREGETGLSIQTLAAEMDAGDILAQKAIPLSTSETAETLSKTIAELAPSMLIPLLQEIAANGITALPKTKQNEADATYCKLLTKDDGRIDWNKSALDIDAQIRAYKPWPPCYTLHGDKLLYVLEGMVGETGVVGTRLAVSLQPGASGAPPGTEVPGTILAADKSLGGIAIQTGDGVYIATKLQYAGKKALGWKDFLNGARDLTGYIFSAML